MDNVFSVFRNNEILLAENEGLDASTLIPVNNKARIVSIMDLGKMLLHCAREGETHKVHELMSRGAPFTTDWLGTTPLHVAAEKNHLSTCEVLLRAGISKDARTKVDRTPLHYAVFEGHEQIVQLLLRHSCDVNARDMLKMTPLHWAVQKGYKNIAKLLLQNGADPNATSKFSKTPISLAAELDQNDLYQELMMRNLQRSDLEQQQAADTLLHELNPDPELIIEDEMDIDGMNNTIELDVIQSSPESSTAFMEDFDSFSTTSNQQSTTDAHVKLSNEEANSANASTLALLKEHGIAMQEDIENTLITSALQSGRQLVLSDAGKLLLNDPKFQKTLPTIAKQSTATLRLTTPSTTTTMPKTGTSTGSLSIKFENVKRKPAILTPSKTLPLEASKVFKVMSAEQFQLMVGNNGGSFSQSKTPNGLIRYQAIKNSNVMTQLVKRKNNIVPNSKIKISPLAGTVKTATKVDSSQSRISNFQPVNTPTTSTMPKETNSDILSRVSFNIIGSSSASTNLPQATTISTGQPYTVKLVSLPQTTAATDTKLKTQIVRQFNQSVVQPRSQQQSPPSPSNGTQMSDIEKEVIELQKLTDELRKQNEEYKFRLEKLENETEREREEPLSRQYTNS